MSGQTKPNIPGGNYRATDTGDGFVTVHDVPIMSEVSKGTKNAPDNIGHDWLDSARKFGEDSFLKNKICYPLHVSHHDDTGIKQPEFAGYFRPTKLDHIEIDGAKKEALFADFKVKSSIFDRMQKGELPYVSPEIRNWNKRRISSVALLDSEPPHFPFPMVTIGDVKADATAKFAADLPSECAIARFGDGFERVTFDPTREKDADKDFVITKEPNMADPKATQNEQAGKPNAAPVEQDAAAKVVVPAKMEAESDPKMAAKFAAMEDANAALMKRLDAIEAEKKAKALESWGLEQMAGYQIGAAAKKSIARFAAEGDASLKEHIAMLQEVTPKDSPRTFAAAEAANAVAINDPKLAKFAQAGPEKLELAAKFASEYRTLKQHAAGAGMSIKEEDYVKFQMEQADGTSEQHWGINLGFGK
jgi:hypothetical protein